MVDNLLTLSPSFYHPPLFSGLATHAARCLAAVAGATAGPDSPLWDTLLAWASDLIADLIGVAAAVGGGMAGGDSDWTGTATGWCV